MSDSLPHFFSRPPEGFGGKISFILTDIVAELRKRNAKSREGIFRLNGNNKVMNSITTKMDNGRMTNFDDYDNDTIACLLKKHFRDMTNVDPLFPPIIFETLSPLFAGNDVNEKFVPAFNEILQKLTRPRYFTIVFLFKYLREVADLKDTNMMGPSNISICMSPNLFACQQSADFIKINDMQNKIVEKIIEFGHELFDGVEVPEEMIIVDSDIPQLLAPVMEANNSSSFLEWRRIRRKSMIPFVPTDLSSIPGFTRPIDPPKE